MTFNSNNKLEKRLYQVAVLGGIIAAPFTSGLSLIASAGGLMASRKYNSVMQTEQESAEEKMYDLVKDSYKKEADTASLYEGGNMLETQLTGYSPKELAKIDELKISVKEKEFLGRNYGRSLNVEVKANDSG